MAELPLVMPASMLLAADFERLAQLFVWAITKPILLGAVAFVPLGIILWRLSRKYARYRAVADEPFTELPLRPPGESVRLKLDELRDTYDTHLVTLVALTVGSYVALVTIRFRPLTFAPLAILAAIGYVYFARKLFRTIGTIWTYKIGWTGERVVGEELNQLLAEGFRVFHDVPFDGFNVDHVIVGAPGVYAVETKTRRKPTDVKGAGRATVTYDGAVLWFPRSVTSEPIEQARRNAKTLAEWLTSATGEPVHVSPVVTLPGWFVERRARSDVNVLNPSEVKHSFPSRVTLSPEQIQRIAHQLSERCRMETRRS